MEKTPLNQKHIFVGQVKDIDVFYTAQQGDKIVRWAIPASAQQGEKGIFLLPRVLIGGKAAFVSTGIITSLPKQDDNRWTKWGADVTIHTFDPPFEPVSLADVQSEFIDWAEIQNRAPWNRSFTISPEFYSPFVNFLKRGQILPSVESQIDQFLR